MKKQQTNQKNKNVYQHSAPRRLLLGTTSAILMTWLATTGRATNVLQNPGFESTPALANWTAVTPEGYTLQAASTQGKLYHSGSNGLWCQGAYDGGANINYLYQTIACAPGSTFTATAYFSQYVIHDGTVGEGGDNGTSGLFTSDINPVTSATDNEDGWVEVLFLDVNGKTLADYRSVILDPVYEANLVANNDVTTNASDSANIYLTWVNCQVTNQYNPSGIVANADPDSFSSAITNTLTSGQDMVAPPGTAHVQYRLSVYQYLYESGATYWDDADLELVGGPAPSVISDVSPSGSQFFNSAAAGLTFNVASASSGGAPLPTNPTSGIKVVVNGADESSSLQFSGSTTDWNVTLPNLVSNQIYSISITVSNSAGLTASANVNFDTFAPNDFVVNVEDYDFTNGMFIQNPIPTSVPAANSYFGTAGTFGVDDWTTANTVGAGNGSQTVNGINFRTDGNVAFQQASDIQLPLYSSQGNPNVYELNLSYNNAGNWENYTRNSYPSGNYFVYGRIAGGAGAGAEYLNIVTDPSTGATNNLGTFVLADGVNWGAYSWIPLTDSFNNKAIVNIPSGKQTLQLLSGGGENFIDFILVPASGGLPPAINNLNPAVNTQNVFVSTNTLAFSVSSGSSTIATSNILASLNGVNVSSTESFSGNGTNWSVSLPLPQNQLLTLVINAIDASGASNSITETFDTFSQNNFMIEASDWDFGGGQFIDNPVPTGGANGQGPAANSYYLYPEGNAGNFSIPQIDYTDTNLNAGETYLYRPEDYAGTEKATDFLRQKFVTNNASEFDLGWWNPGTWLNYTRTFPTNSYHVYGRLAGGGAWSGQTLSQVTNGVGTTTQMTKLLGSFADANANGYQSWHWIPMLNGNGQMATVSLGGVNTLQATAGSGENALFYMFVSVPSPVTVAASTTGGKLLLTFPTQSGFSYTVLSTGSLPGGSWLPVGGAISGTGSNVTVTNSMGQAQQYYKVQIQ